jgi:hypothetical protein
MLLSRYISWSIGDDIDFSSSFQLITHNSHYRKQSRNHHFRLLARPILHPARPRPHRFVTSSRPPSTRSRSLPPHLRLHTPDTRSHTCLHTTAPLVPIPSTFKHYPTIIDTVKPTSHIPAIHSRNIIHNVRPLPIHACSMRGRGL